MGRSAIKRLTEHKEKLIDLIANQRAAVDQFEIVDNFFGEHELIDRKFLSVLGGVDFRGPRISAKSDDINRDSVSGEPIPLPSQMVLSLSLVIHELATNATKYGALANDNGRIDITWRAISDRIEFTWMEKEGPEVIAPSREGFGSRLIRGAFQSGCRLKADFAFTPGGLIFKLEFDREMAG